jgi:hypothetical protein
MKKHKITCLIVALLMLLVGVANAQTAKNSKSGGQVVYTGIQYLLSTDTDRPIKYTRNYSGGGDEFVTTYKLYHPTKGYHAITITATHFKALKKVEVKVVDAGGGLFSDINTEEITYEAPSMESFGYRGSVGALGGDRVPNQLMVKFASSKFENVKIAHIMGFHEDNEWEFFILDVKN